MANGVTAVVQMAGWHRPAKRLKPSFDTLIWEETRTLDIDDQPIDVIWCVVELCGGSRFARIGSLDPVAYQQVAGLRILLV